MKILLLAPHPFYQERGTPIAVHLLVTALIELGHHVDVLTYHEGSDRDYGEAGKVYRIRRPPLCSNIRPGFSLKKVVSDLWLHRLAMQRVGQGNYDVVHAVEESVFMARQIRKRYRIPYVFDMDSSMPAQIADAMSLFRLFMPFMRRFENAAIRDAVAVTVVCDALAEIARQAGARRVILLRDVPLVEDTALTSTGPGLRDELALPDCTFLYIGNLEKYQGIDLLLRAFARATESAHAAVVIVGGIPKHIETYRQLAEELNISGQIHFLGPRPIDDMGSLMRDADVLVSPRTQGQNTPMKIYSYMASRRAILATDLPTHTQVLTTGCAQLAPPEPAPFAQAMDALIRDQGKREALGRAAYEKVTKEYSLQVFKRSVAELYNQIEEDLSDASQSCGE